MQAPCRVLDVIQEGPDLGGRLDEGGLDNVLVGRLETALGAEDVGQIRD
jgi:hypothetical protein